MMPILDNCRNLFGKPLTQDARERLQALICNPCIETWEDAHSIIIQVSPYMTLWQAWIAIDPKAPRRGRAYDFDGNMIRDWERVPSALTILRVLQYATEGDEP